MRTLLLSCALLFGLSACAGPGGHSSGDGGRRHYVLVYLVSGPRSGQGTPEARKAMFEGHMANINRLAQSRQLLIAGPFDKPAEKSMRGLFVFDVPTVPEAERLVATDPGVIAGEFKGEFHEMRGEPGLTRALDLYNEQQAAKTEKAAGAPDASEPPEDLRKYVFVRAKDVKEAKKAAGAAGLGIVWSGEFTGGVGVLALDSVDPDAARDLLTKAGLTEFDTSGWWSTSALMGLPHD
jgi:uncharacterized protein YciI